MAISSWIYCAPTLAGLERFRCPSRAGHPYYPDSPPPSTVTLGSGRSNESIECPLKLPIDIRNSPTDGLLATVASLWDCDAVDLPPLFDDVDADALEAIFAN